MGKLSVSPSHYSMIVTVSFQAIFSSEKKKMVTTQILLSFNFKVKLKQGNN